MSGHVFFSKSDKLNGLLPLEISQQPDHHRGVSTPGLTMSEGKVTEEPSGQTITKFKPKTQKPRLYKVILLNDDFTPMDFVILILKKFFRKSDGDATRIMLQVHNSGAGLAGVFPFELAETKVYQVNEFARSQRHPLKCTMEQQED